MRKNQRRRPEPSALHDAIGALILTTMGFVLTVCVFFL